VAGGGCDALAVGTAGSKQPHLCSASGPEEAHCPLQENGSEEPSYSMYQFKVFELTVLRKLTG